MTRTTTGSTDRRSSRWGERHSIATSALVVAAVAGLVSAADPLPARMAVLAAVVVAAVVPMAYDGLVGLLVGMLAAAGLAAVKQQLGDWTAQSFARSLLTTVLLLLLGWTTGRLGKRLRAEAEPRGRPSRSQVTAFGSLGLVPEAAAMARLEEEVERANRHGRSLSVILVRTTVTVADLDEATAAGALRVAARQFESALRRSDVPFAFAPDLLGAVLVETTSEGAWEVAAGVLERAAGAGFADRGDRSRRRLSDFADLTAGLATLPDDGRDAESLLAAAQTALDDQHRSGGVTTTGYGSGTNAGGL